MIIGIDSLAGCPCCHSADSVHHWKKFVSHSLTQTGENQSLVSFFLDTPTNSWGNERASLYAAVTWKNLSPEETLVVSFLEVCVFSNQGIVSSVWLSLSYRRKSAWFMHDSGTAVCVCVSVCLSVCLCLTSGCSIETAEQVELFLWHGSFLSPIPQCVIKNWGNCKNKGKLTLLLNYIPNFGLRKFRFGISIVKTCYQLSSSNVDSISLHRFSSFSLFPSMNYWAIHPVPSLKKVT